jgi:hypothetical protein
MRPKRTFLAKWRQVVFNSASSSHGGPQTERIGRGRKVRHVGNLTRRH